MKATEVETLWASDLNGPSKDLEYVFTVKGSHSNKLLMQLGRWFPSTKQHAKYWINSGANVDCIGCYSLRSFVHYCKMVSFEPDFKFTKSKHFVRLNNEIEFVNAVKLYFRLR